MPLPYSLNPLGISVRENLPLTFTAVEASTVKLTATGSPTVAGLHYRLGTSGMWLPYTIGTEIPLAAGKKVQFWNSEAALSSSGNDFVNFSMTGVVDAAGSVMSLLNWGELSAACFRGLFANCAALKSPPDLPATTLALRCYQSMFQASGIIRPPELPATTLATACCQAMFAYCSELTDVPSLPAPLKGYCYYQMFRGCAKIKSAVLPSAVLQSYCYYQMFQDCPSLSRIEAGFDQWDDSLSATTYWLLRVSATGTFIKPAALPEEFGTNRIPEGWTVIDK